MALRDLFSAFLLRTSIMLILLLPASAQAESRLMPSGSRVVASDSKGLELRLSWSADSFRETAQGLDLRLPACRLEGREGAPMLPRYRALLALPVAHRPVLQWRLVSSLMIDGEPLPFPTARSIGAESGEGIYWEETRRDPALFAESFPIQIELGAPRWLRDQRVVELLIDPVAWDPERGLRLGTEFAVTIRFAPDTREDADAREPVPARDRSWEDIYRSALLNGVEAAAWRLRVPPRNMRMRGARSEGALRLRLETDGLYGLSGDELVAQGIQFETALDEIALYRHRFSWDAFDQPLFEQIPVPRFFRDRDGDGLLDGNDLMVFVGRTLRHAEDSPDSIEWYGSGSALWLGLAPDLALEMTSSPGWEDNEEDYPVPERFQRHRLVNGEDCFWETPYRTQYLDEEEHWIDDLYYFGSMRQASPYELPIESPAYLSDSSSKLEILWTATNMDITPRFFGMDLSNQNGSFPLPELMVRSQSDTLHSVLLDPGTLVDGGSILTLDRTDATLWQTLFKYWELWYDSQFRVREDSLFFHADGLTGPTEMRVSDLDNPHENWILVRTASEPGLRWQEPARVILGPENQGGEPGDYSLRFRARLAGGETWWLVDEERLLAPAIEPAASLSALDDPGPYDILALVHDDFSAGMERWVRFREGQGYRVKMLPLSEVWEIFFSGCRGAIGIRNAARFAYQQWSAEFVLLVGDACKDARGIGEESMPDFVPLHCYHELVSNVNKPVALDEWVVKFSPQDLPAMMLGRLPVGDETELEKLLDKIECFETYSDTENCRGAGEWRRRLLQIADDAWKYQNIGSCAEFNSLELNFQSSQQEGIDLIQAFNLPGDIQGLPFFSSVITHPWYEEQACADSYVIESYLRPLISPVFIDSLSQGYSFANIQGHANRNQLCHEEIFRTIDVPPDHELLTNYGMPFVWAVYGCHGNEFAAPNEALPSVGDCLGEKLLFLDGNRGAVASYASDGYEFRTPNHALAMYLLQFMFLSEDPGEQVGIFPEWQLGPLLMLTELRYGITEFASCYRMNLLGDPLTRIDAAPPRMRVIIDDVEMNPGDAIVVEEPSDTLRIEALIRDEEYVEWLGMWTDENAALEFAARPLLSRDTALPLDSLVIVDSLAFELHGHSRAWHLSAELPFDFALDTLVVAARDVAQRDAYFRLPVAKNVIFLTESMERLEDGQWIRAAGTLLLDISVPHTEILPEDFSAFADDSLYVEGASITKEPRRFRIELPYHWSPGEHVVEVRYNGNPYGTIRLRVDAKVQVLRGLVFPNPFRNMVALNFELTGAVRGGSLSIYTLSGRLIHRQTLPNLAEGREHRLTWDGSDHAGDRVANGVYISRLLFTDLSGKRLVWEDKLVKMR